FLVRRFLRRGHAPNLAPALLDAFETAFETRANLPVPAIVGRIRLALEACDVEPVAGASHGDVEQTVALVALLFIEGLPRIQDRRQAARALHGPDECIGRTIREIECPELHRPSALARS